MRNECKLPAVLDRLSRGPGEGATGWSARTLLILRRSDSRRNDRGASACYTGASAGRPSAPAVSNPTAAGDSSAASSNAPSAVAVGCDSLVSGSPATATCAAIHAAEPGARFRPFVHSAEFGARFGPFVHAPASGPGHAPSSGPTGARRIVNGRRCYSLASARRAASDQPLPGT